MFGEMRNIVTKNHYYRRMIDMVDVINGNSNTGACTLPLSNATLIHFSISNNREKNLIACHEFWWRL